MDNRVIGYFENRLGSDERLQLLRDATTDAALRHDMEDMLNLQALTTLHPDLRDEDAGADALAGLRHTLRRRKIRHIMRSLLRHAAVLLVGVVATWLACRQLAPKPQPILAQTLTVPAGQRAHLALPDGSTVWVNSGSTITYPSVFGDERRVTLRGEAMFDVVRDTTRQFVVTTDSVETRVLGTRFNVFCYPGEAATVSLLKGKVEVRPQGSETAGVTLRPNEQAVLEGGLLSVGDTPQDPTLWTNGIYAFSGMSLRQLADKLQLYYDVRITIANPRLADARFSGKFRQRDGVMEILRLACKVHPFRISQDTERNTITLY